MRNTEASKILSLLLSCQSDNTELASILAKGLKINLPELLRKEGFYDLGITQPQHFTRSLLAGNFNQRSIKNFRALKYFPHLQRLDCSFNGLKNLEGVENLPQLTTLYAYYNQLQTIEALAPLRELRFLNLRNNQIEHLKGIENLNKLLYLQLNDNKIKDISLLSNLPALTELNLSNNLVKDLSPIYSLPNLRKLTFSQKDAERMRGEDLRSFQIYKSDCRIEWV
jgi:Leucine rich repeat/Leucine Rich repeats (2 copies)